MFRRFSTLSLVVLAASSLVACTINSTSKGATGGKGGSEEEGGSDGNGGSASASRGGKSSVGTSGTNDTSSGGKYSVTSGGSKNANSGGGVNQNQAGSSSSTGGAGSGTGASEGGATGSMTASCKKSGPIDVDTVWEPLVGCPNGFDVGEDIEITGTGTSLTLKPGVKLKFATNTGVLVEPGASLIAVGTADSPITFTGWQAAPGAWGGIKFCSSAIDNELEYAVIEYGGATNPVSAAVVLTSDQQNSYVKISNTQIRDSLQYGLTVYSNANLARFEGNELTRNKLGAIQIDAPNVAQLKGTGNSIVDNGDGNIVRVWTDNFEASVSTDVTWPGLAPAAYRISSDYGSGRLVVSRRLTIEPGAILEFESGGGIEVQNGAAGLSAVGTAAKPILFRGIEGAGWGGIALCGSSWTSNALEEVQVMNAKGPAPTVYCGGSGENEGILLGALNVLGFESAVLRIKNLTVSGPNNAPFDMSVMGGATLTQEGVNKGTGSGGELLIENP